MDEALRRTALTELHEDAGASLSPFAGWAMPLRFAGTIAEHEAVRTGVGVFDVSHLGTLWIEGEGATRAIAAAFTNDPGTLHDGTAQYTLCCDARGGIVDDLLVYRLARDRWLAIPNAANTAAVARVLTDVAGPEVRVVDESDAWAILAVQGPDALALVDGLQLEVLGACDAPSDLRYLGVTEVATGGVTGVLARSGYTGEPGVEFVVPNEAAPALWREVLAAGAEPCGLGARDTLRLEMGYPLHGNELSTDVTPYQARLAWAVRLDRDDFRGRDALRAAKEAAVERRLWGLVTDGRRPARAGMAVLQDGDAVGTVTSGGYSPTLERGIALAYLVDPLTAGDTVTVDVRGAEVAFEVVRPPFVERDPRG